MLYVYFKYTNEQNNSMLVPLIMQTDPNSSLVPFQNFMNSKILNERSYGLKVSSISGTEVPLPTFDKKIIGAIESAQSEDFKQILDILKGITSYADLKNALVQNGLDQFLPALDAHFNYIDVTPLVYQIKQSLEDEIDYDDLKDSLIEGGRSEQFTNAIIPAVSAFFQFIEIKRVFDLQIDVTSMENIALTQKLLLHYRKLGKLELNYLNSPENKTKLQETPEDEIMFRVPTYEELVSTLYKAGQNVTSSDEGGDLDAYVAVAPAQKNLQRPYSNELCFNVAYKQAYSNGSLTDDELRSIEGDARNNDLPLQQNEMRLYNTLKELLQDCLVNSNPAVEATEYIAKCEKEKITDPRFVNYIKALCVVLGKTNWVHSGFLPLSDSDVFYLKDGSEVATKIKVERERGEESSDDDDDDDEDKAEVGLTGFYVNDKGIGLAARQGDMVIYGIIEEISKYDIYAPIELLIRLLRWGSRKPTRFFIPQLNQYLDTFDFKLKDDSGDVGSLTVRKINGCDYAFEDMIKYPVKVTDNNLINAYGLGKNVVNIPVAYKVRQFYNESNISKIVILSIFEVMANNIQIAGVKDFIPIQYNIYNPENGETVSVADKYIKHIQPYEAALVDIQKNGGLGEEYCSDELIASLMELGVPVVEFSPLKALDSLIGDKALKRKISDYEFTTKAEFEQLVEQLESGESIKDVINSNIIKIYYAALLQLVKIVAEDSIKTPGTVRVSTIINYYKQFVQAYTQAGKDLSVKNLVPITVEEVVAVEQEPSTKSETGTVNAFGTIATVDAKTPEGEPVKAEIVEEVTPPKKEEEPKAVVSDETLALKERVAELERVEKTLRAENQARMEQIKELQNKETTSVPLNELAKQVLFKTTPTSGVARPFKNTKGEIVAYMVQQPEKKSYFHLTSKLDNPGNYSVKEDLQLSEIDFLLTGALFQILNGVYTISFSDLGTLSAILNTSKFVKQTEYKENADMTRRLSVINRELGTSVKLADFSKAIIKSLVPTEQDTHIAQSANKDNCSKIVKVVNNLKNSMN